LKLARIALSSLKRYSWCSFPPPAGRFDSPRISQSDFPYESLLEVDRPSAIICGLAPRHSARLWLEKQIGTNATEPDNQFFPLPLIIILFMRFKLLLPKNINHINFIFLFFMKDLFLVFNYPQTIFFNFRIKKFPGMVNNVNLCSTGKFK